MRLVFQSRRQAGSSRPPNLAAACDSVSRAVCGLLCVGGMRPSDVALELAALFTWCLGWLSSHHHAELQPVVGLAPTDTSEEQLSTYRFHLK